LPKTRTNQWTIPDAFVGNRAAISETNKAMTDQCSDIHFQVSAAVPVRSEIAPEAKAARVVMTSKKPHTREISKVIGFINSILKAKHVQILQKKSDNNIGTTPIFYQNVKKKFIFYQKDIKTSKRHINTKNSLSDLETWLRCVK